MSWIKRKVLRGTVGLTRSVAQAYLEPEDGFAGGREAGGGRVRSWLDYLNKGQMKLSSKRNFTPVMVRHVLLRALYCLLYVTKQIWTTKGYLFTIRSSVQCARYCMLMLLMRNDKKQTSKQKGQTLQLVQSEDCHTVTLTSMVYATQHKLDVRDLNVFFFVNIYNWLAQRHWNTQRPLFL